MSARNYYIMQSAVAPMQSELPCYTPLTNHRTEVHTVPLVMAADYAALEAECERLRAKLAETKEQSETRWAGYVRESNLRREIEAERDALRAELDGLRGDAERMEWLESAWGGYSGRDGGFHLSVYMPSDAETLREMIDAALSASTGEGLKP